MTQSMASENVRALSPPQDNMESTTAPDMAKSLRRCPYCDHVGACARSLREHVNGVHMGTKEYKCDDCDFDTAYRSTLKNHASRVHGKAIACERVCDKCGHKATNAYNLR